jgi:hypothetical protein
MGGGNVRRRVDQGKVVGLLWDGVDDLLPDGFELWPGAGDGAV